MFPLTLPAPASWQNGPMEDEHCWIDDRPWNISLPCFVEREFTLSMDSLMSRCADLPGSIVCVGPLSLPKLLWACYWWSDLAPLITIYGSGMDSMEDVFSRDVVKFSVTPSSKGGIDIEISSRTIHVPKYVRESDFAGKGESLGEMAFMMNGPGTRTTVPPMANHANGASKFILDSGATHHFSSNREHFSDWTSDQTGREVCVADGRRLRVVAGGSVNHGNITLNNVLYVPGLATNIVSVSKLAELDYSVDFTKTGCFIRDHTEPENHSEYDLCVAAEHDIIKAEDKTAATWLVASGAQHHATGNISLLSGFTPEYDLFVQAGDGAPMQVCGRGSVITDAVVLPDVWFVPGLTANLVSASQLTEIDYSVGFSRGMCNIRNATDGSVVGKAYVGEGGLFELDFLKVPLVSSKYTTVSRTACAAMVIN